VLRLVFYTAALSYLRGDLGLVSLIVAPFFWLTISFFSHVIKQASSERRRRSGSISAVAEESLANVALIQAYNRQNYEVERFHREILGKFAVQVATTRLRRLYSRLNDLIELTGIPIVVGLGTWDLSEGRLTLGSLLIFIAYVTQFYSPIRGLDRLTNTVYSAAASAERIIEFLEQRPSVTERADAISLPWA
jgi:ABC-type multidrug transport system fused ATPase/permease subunit